MVTVFGCHEGPTVAKGLVPEFLGLVQGAITRSLWTLGYNGGHK